METRTYLINTLWDYSKKELIQVDGNQVTIQFKFKLGRINNENISRN